jgi:hypothetical protein
VKKANEESAMKLQKYFKDQTLSGINQSRMCQRCRDIVLHTKLGRKTDRRGKDASGAFMYGGQVIGLLGEELRDMRSNKY